MSTLLAELRHAARALLAAPALTAAAVLSLGLGIGANTTVFSWIQAVLLRPVPGAARPDELRATYLETRDGRGRSWSYPNYRDFRDRARTFTAIAQDDLALSVTAGGQPERTLGMLVSGNYFHGLGVMPFLGRLLHDTDDRAPGAHPVVVISHAYWQQRFNSDPAVVGKEVIVNAVPMTVIGVTPSGFHGSLLGVAAAAWVPMAMQPQMLGGNRLDMRGSSFFNVLVRLREGRSSAEAQAEASTLLAQLAQEHPGSFDGWRITVSELWRSNWGAPTVLAPILGVLFAVVCLVLLMACANVANLLLSRALGRRREIATRLSLGATRARIVRQLLTEALLLAGCAGVVGVALSYWSHGVLMAFVPPVDVSIDLGLAIDRTTLAFAAAATLLTGLLFGLVPAWQLSRGSSAQASHDTGSRGATGGRATHRLRQGLVIAQVAACLVLLVTAGLFTRSFRAAGDIDLGFAPDGLLIAAVDLTPNGYGVESGRAFQRRLLDEVRALPGTEAAALARAVPLGLSGSSSQGISVRGYTPRSGEELNVVYNQVSPDYFATMRVPVLEGREFTGADATESRKVVVINETMAQRYWPAGDALGGTVRASKEDYEVVGVVRDHKYFSLAEDPLPHLYYALEQNFASTSVLHLRSSSDPTAMLSVLRDAVRRVDPNLPLYGVRTMREHLQTAVFAQRMGASLLGVLGLLAVLLASVGLYGVIAFMVSQRTRELGIRLALGATPRGLLAMVLRQGMLTALAGVGAGLVVSLAAAGLLRTLLPGVGPYDPITFVGVSLLLLTIASIAAVLPARRAGSTDPAITLRQE